MTPSIGKILILCGLPGAGKTRKAHEWVAEDVIHRFRVNYDDLRIELYGADWKFNRPEEDAMKQEALRRASHWILQAPGNSVVIDNLNLTTGSRKLWMDLGRALNCEVELYEIDTSLLECITRDRFRAGKARVGEAVITRWAAETGHIDWSTHVGKFIIVDVDGTIADTSARQRHLTGGVIPHKITCAAYKGNLTEPPLSKCPQCGMKAHKDWGKFFAEVDKDPVIQPIVDLVMELAGTYHVIVCSGRPSDSCGIKTEDWLHRNKIPYDFLFMRKGGDFRSDTVVKQEILELLPPIDRIAYVLDDRDSVVEMWRRNGLTCLQCAKGDF